MDLRVGPHLLFFEGQMSLASTPSRVSQQTELDNGPLSAPRTPLMQSESLFSIESDVANHLPTISETGTLFRTSKHPSPSSMSLAYADISYSQQISLESPTLDLQIDEVSIMFEFLEVGAESLSV